MSEKDHEQLMLLNDFPLLVPMRDDFTVYQGYIDIGGEEVWVHVAAPEYPRLTGMAVRCLEKPHSHLIKHKRRLEDWTESCSSLHHFLTLFRELMETVGETNSLSTPEFPPSEVYEKLLSDLQNVGLENVVNVSSNIDEVQLKYVDVASREHILTLKAKDLRREYTVSAELPQKAMIKIQGGSMVSAYRTFSRQVDDLQGFWNALEELNTHCWVTDPEVVNLAHSHRRINIGNNVSIQVTLDPLNMSRPDVRVLGSSAAIQPFTDALAASCQEQYELSADGSIVSYLLDCLALPCFPSKPRQSAPDVATQLVQTDECAICYLARLSEGQMPDVACDEVKCARLFHSSCLFQWLDSLQSPIRYDRIHGNCPNCNANISCEVSFT